MKRILENREAQEFLTIPMSFFREACNDFRNHRYVAAFYGFYFFLDDLYGAAKTKNRQVMEEFLDSAQLRGAFEEAYRVLSEPATSSQKAAFDTLVARLNCATSVEGLVEFVVLMRGELHHFSQRSNRPKGHPLNQELFQPVAFFLMTVCVTLITRLAMGEKPDK